MTSLVSPRPMDSRTEMENDFYFDLTDIAENEQERVRSFLIQSGPHQTAASGMNRVPSCYFSLKSNSEASASAGDLTQLLPDSSESVDVSAVPVLYHDIMMTVFSYLPSPSLAAFSEASRRANFEVFYFLQLQLQNALRHVPSDAQSEISAVRIVDRHARLDRQGAESAVQDYLDSNSALRNTPLGHSLARLRHVLSRQGFYPSSARAAALAVTLMGVSLMGSGSAIGDYSEALRYGIIKVGLAGGLMKAAAEARHSKHDGSHMGGPFHGGRGVMESAEQLARMLQEHFPHLPTHHFHNSGAATSQPDGQTNVNPHSKDSSSVLFPSSIAARLYWAFYSVYRPHHDQDAIHNTHSSEGTRPSHKPSTNNYLQTHLSDAQHSLMNHQALDAMEHPLTPDPYDHLPSPTNSNDNTPSSTASPTIHNTPITPPPSRKKPTGCMTAFMHTIDTATRQVHRIIKERRKSDYLSLPEDERLRLSTLFIDACASDANLPLVKDILQNRMAMDVDGFFIGSDGTETCALHTAAFHGAHLILEFLCRGVGEAEGDGGMCDIDLRDENGWTALHFAAGSNAVSALRVLARYGAKLTLEARNGYTPYHWAERLSNEDVAVELRTLGADQRFLDVGWMTKSFFHNPFLALVSSD